MKKNVIITYCPEADKGLTSLEHLKKISPFVEHTGIKLVFCEDHKFSRSIEEKVAKAFSKQPEVIQGVSTPKEVFDLHYKNKLDAEKVKHTHLFVTSNRNSAQILLDRVQHTHA